MFVYLIVYDLLLVTYLHYTAKHLLSPYHLQIPITLICRRHPYEFAHFFGHVSVLAGYFAV